MADIDERMELRAKRFSDFISKRIGN
ncbi:MAG: hypothetical protein RL468_2741, partial [Pseudomonadota bacterium]